MTDWCIDQQQASLTAPAELGGKAHNLAFLSRFGFNVPQWWVVPVAAFELQLQLRTANGESLSDWIQQQLHHFVGKTETEVDSQALTRAAEDIQQRLAEVGLHPDILAAVRAALPQQDLNSEFWAVRSSVVGEDSAGASFAGQMDSYLYQKGETAIADSVLKVMQSAFNARALAYRLQKGLSVVNIQAAVIIQRMLDADVSGVMFTANPVNGNRRQALISATWGCGEGLVSGICNADEITVGLYDNQIDAQTADKDIALRQGPEGGTVELAVEENLREQLCLSDAHILALRDAGKAIAESYQSPQDIEWCVQDNQIYILQARPVTSLPQKNSDEDRLQVWDNSNIQESYCGVTTPLTFSFANRAYKTVYEQTMRLIGVKEDVVQAHQGMLENMLGLVRGRVYYNINNWYRGLLFLPSFKTNKADMERMMGLQDPVDLIQDRELTSKEKLARIPQVIRALFSMLGRFRKMDQLVEKFRSMFAEQYASVPREQLHTYSMDQLIELSRSLDENLLQRWTTPIVNDFYVMMMNGKVHRWLEKTGIENIDLVQNNLLSGEEGIESTEPTKYLLRLCDQARTQPLLLRALQETDNDQLLTLLQQQFPSFHAQCLDYIERYGDRTMGELKLESKTLRQDASFMFAILKNFLTRDDLTLETLAQNEAKFRADAEEQVFPLLKQKLGGRALAKFNKDLAKLRDAIRNRENMRLARTRMFGLYRDIYRQLGEQLAFYGQLDEAEDIFYLTVEDIYAYSDGRSISAVLRPLVAARKAEFAQYETEEEPAHHFHTRGVVYCNNDYDYPFQEEIPGCGGESGNELQGTGCYPGIVENNIRLIFSPEDELNLDGQILCTVRTDPGWAPLFPTAGGILVERGSTLSHSAVVARELGIPAVVGIPGLTSIVKDRELVRMDGSSGRVVRLEVEAEADA
ncbi:phosphoenolpyruvate synthase [Bacterioplanoides sp. SCSIO 12839]|uniref:phosphoenolpyruvate synthase n=1 Tax=Bacterioplanoides sp. SCSIO 12839 TaxID=2829569 RepID=UPI0021021F2B|nr:phosphoenolpyruvate synthase [Bacterioplanoides sp. SCSIO 12839]UTW49359.1 phosphoenolpyruvate synthase [Bacterioplanoides sp. SCSIO 12839]